MVVPFPFSDLSPSKRRPALVLAELGGDDPLLCQITSRRISDQHAVRIDDEDFETGSLQEAAHQAHPGIHSGQKYRSLSSGSSEARQG